MVHSKLDKINMDIQTLTIKNLLIGKWYGLVNSLAKPNSLKMQTSYAGYRLLKKFSLNNEPLRMKAGLYENKNKDKVIIKMYGYRYTDLFYWHMLNEAHILNLLSKKSPIALNGYIYSFPKLKLFVNKNNIVTIITEYCRGQLLSTMNSKEKVQILNGCLTTLRGLTSSLTSKDKMLLPKRTPFHVLVSFPYFCLKAFIHDPFDAWVYFKMAILFYLYYFDIKYLLFSHYVLSHRDLHSKNIIIEGNNVKILDPGLLVLWDKQADASIIPLLHFKEIGLQHIYKLLQNEIHTHADWKRFVSLNIYYTIESLAVAAVATPDYQLTKEYLNNYLWKVIRETKI